VGALPKPEAPAWPIQDLFDALHELHHQAGWPSLREMAKEVGCSHTTISAAFSEPRVPRWGLLELIVETLGGETERFHKLWLAASVAARDPGQAQPPSPPPSSPPSPPLPGQAVASLPPPRELPPDVTGFTGRADQLAALDQLLDSAGAAAPAIVISAVSGTAGVGKTALAVHWAHRMASHFPDGQLYVDLRGYDPGQPVSPASALQAFLRTLGLRPSAIPTEQAELAARYRTMVAGRRMLVLLDNAHSVDQVRDLLPGTPSCLVVVTSRDALPALIARHGAARVNLDLLPPDEAMLLLRRLIGDRVTAEPVQAAALAVRCARLPLALRIAAEIAISRPRMTLAQLVAELSDEPARLDLLGAGDDQRTAVRAVFSWSLRQLSGPAARAFRLLGTHPGRDIDGDAAAALLGTDRAAATGLLAALGRAHLVEETAPGRFGLHDLLRAYAVELAAVLDGPDRLAVRQRLFDYYLDTAAEATVLVGYPHGRSGTGPAARARQTFIVSAGAARSWLESERSNLIAVAQAALDGSPSHTIRLATTLARYLDARGHYLDTLTLHELAVKAARADRDPSSEARALNLLGTAHRRLGRYPEALTCHQQALVILQEAGDRDEMGATLHGLGTLCWRQGRYSDAHDYLAQALAAYRDLGDRGGEATALYGLGIVGRRRGRYQDALDYYQQALAIYREVGNRASEGGALGNLGVVYLRLGRLEEALDQHQRSLAIHAELGDRTGTGVALTNLGATYLRLGRYDDALAHHQQALEIYREVGYRAGQADALQGIGIVLGRLGQPADALEHLHQAVALSRELGEADLEAAALNDLGTVLRAARRLAEAADRHQSALALAGQTGDRYEQARAHDSLGHLHDDGGRAELARENWQRAHALYTDLGVPEAAVTLGNLHLEQPVEAGA
jgi:tetratricopeptide (TPR) repeat protein